MIYRGVHWELVLECSQVDYKKIGNRSSALSVFEFGEPLKNAVVHTLWAEFPMTLFT